MIMHLLKLEVIVWNIYILSFIICIYSHIRLHAPLTGLTTTYTLYFLHREDKIQHKNSQIASFWHRPRSCSSAGSDSLMRQNVECGKPLSSPGCVCVCVWNTWHKNDINRNLFKQLSEVVIIKWESTLWGMC